MKEIAKYKNIIMVITIVIVFSVITFIIGFGVGNKFKPLEKEEIKKSEIINKDEEKEEKESSTNNQEITSINEESTKSLEKISKAEYEQILYDIDEVYIRNYALDFKNNIKNISSEKLIEKAIMNESRTNRQDSYSKDVVRKYVNRYFGKEYKYEDKSVYCDLDKKELYKYNDGKYTFQDVHGHDAVNHENFVGNYLNIIKYERVNNKIIVETKILYGADCRATCGPTTKFKINPEDENYALEASDFGNNNFAVSLSDYKRIESNIPITTFTFIENDDGTYYLDNVEINKTK